ncbi:MAG: histidine triad nucleotide-binding protein [Candidatus Saganbacteria bacterium]|nr:histidine triad nucleotide-binding protein [Candidatus Saganbacteria bacterium]
MPDCLFCKIANKQIPSEVVYEDDRVLAFKDSSPQAPVHILLIPKEHIASTTELGEKFSHVAKDLFAAVPKVASKFSLLPKGFRVVINQGPHAGQAVDHLHLHILGGRQMHWPPG